MTKYDRFHMFMAGALIVGFIGPMDQIMSLYPPYEVRTGDTMV